jgi:hypothetical protein
MASDPEPVASDDSKKNGASELLNVGDDRPAAGYGWSPFPNFAREWAEVRDIIHELKKALDAIKQP